MAGHSHSSNVKHRKDRQDSARNQLFIRLRRQLEQLIRSEKGVTEKVLALARKNEFPKKRIYRIQEQINREGKTFDEGSLSGYTFFKAKYEILLSLKNDDWQKNDYSDKIKEISLTEIPSANVLNYFCATHCLEISKEEMNALDFFLELPSSVLEGVEYEEIENNFLIKSIYKDSLTEIKFFMQEKVQELTIKERIIWLPKILCQLTLNEERGYYLSLQKVFQEMKITY